MDPVIAEIYQQHNVIKESRHQLTGVLCVAAGAMLIAVGVMGLASLSTITISSLATPIGFLAMIAIVLGVCGGVAGVYI